MPESSKLENPVYTIVVSEKGGPERREVFRSNEVTVGRVHGNDIVLPRGNVSKRHARVLYREGRFIVTDLNSTNGTYVNRRRIAQATIVREDDKIYVGDFVLRVELGAAPAEAGEVQEGRATQPERDSSPEGRQSNVDWDRPSSFDGQRVSSGPPRAALASEHPAADRISTSSQMEDLAGPHLQAVADVVRSVRQVLGDVPVTLPEEYRSRIDALVNEAADDLMLRGAVPTSTSLEAISAQARSELLELGPLDELLADTSVTTISASRYDNIVVRRDDRVVRVTPGFSSAGTLDLAIRRMCARAGSPLGDHEAYIERDLGELGQLTALAGSAAATGPLLVLRKPRRLAASLDGLVRRGTVSRAMATFLTQAVTSRLNILVVGSRGDGAGTVMSALCGVAARERVIAVSKHDDFAPRTATRLNLQDNRSPAEVRQILELAGAVAETRLAIQLSTPELAVSTLEAMGSGMSGVLASLPCSDLRRALIRLPADIAALRPGMNLQAAMAWVHGSFDLLVEVSRLRDGRVRTLRVSEFEYADQGTPILHDVFRFNVQRVAVGGSVEGSFAPTGYLPRVASHMQALGASIETTMFSRPPSR